MKLIIELAIINALCNRPLMRGFCRVSLEKHALFAIKTFFIKPLITQIRARLHRLTVNQNLCNHFCNLCNQGLMSFSADPKIRG